MSKGLLQHDLWNVKAPSNRWDWDTLRTKIAQHGVRNSLLVAPMPTASTSQVDCYTGGTPADHPIYCLSENSEMIESIDVETRVWSLSLHANNLRRGGLNTYIRAILPTNLLIGSASHCPSITGERLDLLEKICCTRWSRHSKIVWAETCMLQWMHGTCCIAECKCNLCHGRQLCRLTLCSLWNLLCKYSGADNSKYKHIRNCSTIVIALHTHSWSPEKTQGVV